MNGLDVFFCTCVGRTERKLNTRRRLHLNVKQCYTRTLNSTTFTSNSLLVCKVARYHAESTRRENEAHEKGTGKDENIYQAPPLQLHTDCESFSRLPISTPLKKLLQSVFLILYWSLLAPKSVSSVCLILVYIEAPRVFRGLKIESFSSRAALRFA